MSRKNLSSLQTQSNSDQELFFSLLSSDQNLEKILQLIKEKRINLSHLGQLPLQYCIEYKSVQIFSALLEHGAQWSELIILEESESELDLRTSEMQKNFQEMQEQLKVLFFEKILSACKQATSRRKIPIFLSVKDLGDPFSLDSISEASQLSPMIIALISQKMSSLEDFLSNETYEQSALQYLVSEISASGFLRFCFNIDIPNTKFEHAKNILIILETLKHFESNFLCTPRRLPDLSRINELAISEKVCYVRDSREVSPFSTLDIHSIFPFYLPKFEKRGASHSEVKKMALKLKTIEEALMRSIRGNVVKNIIVEIDGLIDQMNDFFSEKELQALPLVETNEAPLIRDSTVLGVIRTLISCMRDFQIELSACDRINWKQTESTSPAIRHESILPPRQYYQLCQILEIEPSSSWHVMRERFAIVRKKHHPDQGGTAENFRIWNNYIQSLQAHHAAIEKLSSAEVEQLLSEISESKVQNNRAYNQFLFARVFNHTTESQQKNLFSSPNACKLGLWDYPDLLMSVPVEILQENLLDVFDFDRWKSIIFHLHLTMKIIVESPVLICKWPSSDTAEFAFSKKVDLLIAFYNSISTKEWLFSDEGVSALVRLIRSIMDEQNLRNVAWPTASRMPIDTMMIPFYRVLMEIMLCLFAQNPEKRFQFEITNEFAIFYHLHPILLTDEQRGILKNIYQSVYQAPDQETYFQWLMFDRDAIKRMPQNNFAELINRTEIRIAEILIRFHHDHVTAQKILGDLYSQFKEREGDIAEELQKTDISSRANYYFHLIVALKQVGYQGLTAEESKLALIPNWQDIRSDMLRIINRFMVINSECHRVLVETRRALIRIDQQQDLSDKAKVQLMLGAFQDLIDSINQEARSGILVKVNLALKLKPLAEQFFYFIEKHFFLVSQDEALFKRVQYVKNAPEELRKKVCLLERRKFSALAKLRLVALDYRHTPSFFNPGWNIEVYEALDRLRQLAYEMSSSFFTSFFAIFGNHDRESQASLISDLIESIQFEPPETIMEKLLEAKKDQKYAEISGFIQAVDGTRQTIREIAGLIADNEENLLMLADKESDFQNSNMPKVKK